MDFLDDERISPKTKISELFNLVEQNKTKIIEDLKEAVSIPSIINDPDHQDDIIKMLHFCTKKLKDLGATVSLVDCNSNSNTNFPPVIFAHLFTDDEHKTICVYGSIDVKLEEKTLNDKLFDLSEKNGKLYGCGVSDNKASLFCWFNALEMYKISKNEIPVNIKFVIEATSEIYSQSLSNAIQNQREFFKDVEYICLTIDKKVNESPCLKYGFRGLCHFSLRVTCGNVRVHSGTYGGAFNQPFLDIINVVGSLVDKQGKITIKDFLKDKKPTEVDEMDCTKENCTIESIKKEIDLKFLIHKKIPSRIILHKTRLPNLTINAFQIKSISADKDDCASIPNIIEAIFSVRLVPNQTDKRTYEQFKRHIEKMWHHCKSANAYEFKMKIGFNPWQGNPSSNHYKAAEAAIHTVYNVAPNYLSEGYTIPAVSIFNTFCPASNIIVMPISGHNDRHYSNSESISINDYIQGVKLAIAYMCEIHEINLN